MLKKNLGLLQSGRVVKDIAMLETGLRKVVEASWVSTPAVWKISVAHCARKSERLALSEILFGLCFSSSQ